MRESRDRREKWIACAHAAHRLQCQGEYNLKKKELADLRDLLTQDQDQSSPLTLPTTSTGPSLAKSGYLFVRSSGPVRCARAAEPPIPFCSSLLSALPA